MGRSNIVKKISVDKYEKGMKIIKCDKSWIDPKLYTTNIAAEETIEILKSYGVKEIVVEFTQENDNFEEKNIEKDEEEKLREEVEKSLTSLVLSDLSFVQNVYPNLVNNVKHFFDNASKGQLDKETVSEVTDTVCESTLKNPIFVVNISKYSDNYEYLYNHSLNLAFLANTIGVKLGYTEDKIRELTMAALLHDVGKVFIDQNILNKRGKLNDREFAEIKKHPILGYKYLLDSGGFTENVLLAVLEHHEKGNGEGYPRGLKSAEISYYAKIIGIIDSYDAITNDTCYRSAYAQDKAIELLYSFADIHYSKRLLDFIVKIIRFHSLGTVVRLDSGEVGLIVKQFFDNREPVVLIVRDVKKKVEPPVLFDLNSYDIKTGQPYKKIVEVVSKSEIDFNPATILYEYIKRSRDAKVK
jgi:HD-GYP domain-containing protein (c-di-GMP phosphodiesterase class II)